MATTVTTYVKTRRWTRVEYDHLVDLDVFQPGERIELLDGELVVREPPGREHSSGIRCVVRTLQRALGDTWQIDSQFPFALDDVSEPQPDVAVVPLDPNLYRDGHPSHAVLLVEVAWSSYRIDHNYKAGLYARAGIAEYWIVDLNSETLEVHRAPETSVDAAHGWRYGSVEVLTKSASVSPLAAPGVVIPVADLLL
jgi:Uma2 family endonuclease